MPDSWEDDAPVESSPASSGDREEPEAEASQREPSDGEEAPALSMPEARASIEAILYAAGDPLSLRELRKVLPEAPELVKPALESLAELYQREERGLQLVEVAGGWQITTRPEYHDRVSRLLDTPRPPRLSLQALETLAVIAYRQPITVPEIMDLRGVRSAGVVRTLLERKLVKIVGRKEVVGRPLLYGTTKEFLLRFGLKSLKDLPQLKDMSDVFGEEVAQQLETLEALEETGEPPEKPGKEDKENEPEKEEKVEEAEGSESATEASSEEASPESEKDSRSEP